MRQSKFEDAVATAWPALEAAIKTGLADKANRNLGAVVPLVERTRELAAHVELWWTPSDGCDDLAVRALMASVTGVYELSVATKLEDFMKQPTTSGPKRVDDMEALGRDARRLEYRWVLSQVVEAAQAVDSLTVARVKEITNTGAGWRLLAFRQKSDIETELKGLGNVEVVGASFDDAGGPVAVLFPLGRTTVSRLDDFTASAERDDAALAVSLTARLKLLGLSNAEWPITKFAGVGKPRTAPSARRQG